MITLVDAIGRIRETEYRSNNWDEPPAFTEDGVNEIKALLEFDRCFKIAEQYDHFDGVLLADTPWVNDLVVGKRYAGDVFFDKKERFPDGSYIIIGTVKQIEQLYSEIYLVRTNRSTYLVIK